MKILVVGSGGREHALAWKLARSPRVSEVVATPGNAGIAAIARTVSTGLDPESILEVARRERADLVVIGPEGPLVDGAVDLLSGAGIRAFGPMAAGARLEGSKAFAKEFMTRHAVPTAAFGTFTDLEAALDYLSHQEIPIVVKDSRLAAGKGVTVATTSQEAESAVRSVLAEPGREVVIESFLGGQEISFLVFTDGTHWLAMPLAQDYKQAEDGDRGPMTGGMGVVAPVRLLAGDALRRVETEIVERTLEGLRKDGVDYRGVLYFGLMLTDRGPMVLEYNVRFGDPETQTVLPLLESDLVEILEACIDRRLDAVTAVWSGQAAACVVMAAAGYPGEYRRHVPLRLPPEPPGVTVFHAGTTTMEGRLVSSGGRVLNVVARGKDIAAAVGFAYGHVEEIDFPDAKFRRDIGSRLR